MYFQRESVMLGKLSAFPVGGRSRWVWDTRLIRGKRGSGSPAAAVAGSPPHMKPISSISVVVLCKKMSVYQRLRPVQLGTHRRTRARGLFWFSLACLNFSSRSMWLPESKLIMDIWTAGLGHFERNNNFLLWTTYFFSAALWRVVVPVFHGKFSRNS